MDKAQDAITGAERELVAYLKQVSGQPCHLLPSFHPLCQLLCSMRTELYMVQGSSSAVDEAHDAITEAEQELAAYLKRVSGQLGGKVEYVSLHKENHVLEVPQVSRMNTH